MTKTTVSIEGMSCGHCVNRVKKALDSLAGVAGSEVNIGSATVSYDESSISDAEIIAAIEKAGYRIAR